MQLDIKHLASGKAKVSARDPKFMWAGVHRTIFIEFFAEKFLVKGKFFSLTQLFR
jgi:hypothetical protein